MISVETYVHRSSRGSNEISSTAFASKGQLIARKRYAERVTPQGSRFWRATVAKRGQLIVLKLRCHLHLSPYNLLYIKVRLTSFAEGVKGRTFRVCCNKTFTHGAANFAKHCNPPDQTKK